MTHSEIAFGLEKALDAYEEDGDETALMAACKAIEGDQPEKAMAALLHTASGFALEFGAEQDYDFLRKAVAYAQKLLWRPIATAPVDTQVLIVVEGHPDHDPVVGEARYWASVHAWYWSGVTPDDHFGDCIENTNFGSPTRWRPMPKAGDA